MVSCLVSGQKQINRGISMSVKDNELKFKLREMYLGYRLKIDFKQMKFVRF